MHIDTRAAPRPSTRTRSSTEIGVLVGFDGSKQSVQALQFGAQEATRSGLALTVVCAYSIPVPVYTTLGALPEKSEAKFAHAAALKVLDEARGHLRDHPGQVTYRCEHGDATGVMRDLSAEAELVVVGARGRGGFIGRILGSVSSALPAHAYCPVVVVPPQPQQDGSEDPGESTANLDQLPVIVGIDGSQHSRLAALQAAQAAQNRRTSLHMVMALPSLEGWLNWYPEIGIPDEGIIDRRKSQLEESLGAEVAWLSRHFPALTVTAVVKPGDPVAQLSESTRDAQLMVLGTRGHSGLTDAILGSVSRGVLLRAQGPIMIVPEMPDGRLIDQPEFIR